MQFETTRDILLEDTLWIVHLADLLELRHVVGAVACNDILPLLSVVQVAPVKRLSQLLRLRSNVSDYLLRNLVRERVVRLIRPAHGQSHNHQAALLTL